jgi:hypothetical protein
METKRERLKKQKAQLRALDAREAVERRKLDTRRKVVVGGAALAHAARDAGFADALRAVLAVAVTRPIDRKVIADLLGESVPPDSSGQESGSREKKGG